MASERIKQTASGPKKVWVVNFVDPIDGKRKQRSFDKKADAMRFENSAVAVPVAVRKRKRLSAFPTLREMADTYIEDSLAGRNGDAPWSTATAVTNRNYLKAIFRFADEHAALDIFDRRHCREIRDEVLRSELSRTYQKSIFQQLKAVLQYACEKEILTDNPARDLTIRLVRKATNTREGGGKLQLHSKEEARAILTTALALRALPNKQQAKTWSWNWITPALLFETGMRISEALALEWDSVDLNEGTIEVRQSIDRDQVVKTPKTAAGFRTLYVGDSLIAALDEHKRAATGIYVLSGLDGQLQDYRNALRRWYNLQTKAGVTKLGFHATRHFYASRLIEAGVDAKVLTTNMGHTDPAFTLRVYGHLFDDRDTRDTKKRIANSISLMGVA